VTPVDGGFVVPTGPGLECDPDPDVLKTYAA
jgi:D-galactarolactone cycloisomerase